MRRMLICGSPLLFVSVWLGLLTGASTAQISMQFPVERDVGIDGWDNHNGYGGVFDKTLETGKCHYYSRSRGKLWLKGEESGHTQSVKAVFLDCDSDSLLIKVGQKGGACHTGYKSCFFTQVEPRDRTTREVGKKIFDPKEVYKRGK